MTPTWAPFLRKGQGGLLSSIGVAPFLLPFLYTHTRAASILSNLSDNRSAYKKRIRRGRGPASGKGKTAGRGYNGQKQKGTVPRGFNGGQTPLEVSHGIRGFTNVFSVDMIPLNLNRLQAWVDQGRIDPSKPITIKELGESRCINNIKDGVKLLARGSEELRSPLNVIVSRASTAAIEAIEKAGGSVTTRFYTPFAIKRILRGKTDPINSIKFRPVEGEQPRRTPFMPRLPDPTSRKDLEYYRDPAHRGYLSYQVAEGQSPSLFWKAPGALSEGKRRSAGKGKAAADNRIW